MPEATAVLSKDHLRYHYIDNIKCKKLWISDPNAQ